MGQKGKAHEVLKSAKSSFAAAQVVLPLVKRYYRLYAELQGSELDSFPAGQTDLVRAKPTRRRLVLQVYTPRLNI